MLYGGVNFPVLNGHVALGNLLIIEIKNQKNCIVM